MFGGSLLVRSNQKLFDIASLNPYLWIDPSKVDTINVVNGLAESIQDLSSYGRVISQNNLSLRPSLSLLDGKNYLDCTGIKYLTTPNFAINEFTCIWVFVARASTTHDRFTVVGASNNTYIPLGSDSLNGVGVRVNGTDAIASIVKKNVSISVTNNRDDIYNAFVTNETVVGTIIGCPAISSTITMGASTTNTIQRVEGGLGELICLPGDTLAEDLVNLQSFLVNKWT